MIAAPPGFWRLVRPHRSLLAIAFAAMVVESAASLWEPWPLKLIVDHVIGGTPLPPVDRALGPLRSCTRSAS